MRLTSPNSLANLCRDFKLPKEYSKTEFPHKFASKENLNYIGAVPSSEYWKGEKIPEEWEEEKYFDFKEVSINYQKLDVVSLCIIIHKLSREFFNVTHLKATDFLTGSSLAYQYIMENINPPRSIVLCSDRATDAWIRRSIQGGRCFPQKPSFISSSADTILQASGIPYLSSILEENDLPSKEIIEYAYSDREKAEIQTSVQKNLKKLYDECNDYLVCMDAVSLYPSAMYEFEYPIGEPNWESLQF